MPGKIKITKTVVEKLPFAEKGKQIDYYDSVLPAFGIRVSATSKVYFVRKRVNGKMSRIILGKHSVDKMTADAARDAAQDAFSEIRRGIDRNLEKKKAMARGLTLADAADQYFESRDLKKSTTQNYKLHLDTHFKDWQKKPLKDITREMVAARHLKISKSSGAASANNTMKVLRLFYNYASGKFPGTLPDNPVKVLSHARQWNRVERRKSVIEISDLPYWFTAVEKLQNPTIKDFFKLLLYTGLRKNEALQLKWADVDMQNKKFTIIDTKNKKPHTLPMSDYLVVLFKERLAVQENDFVFPGTGKSGHLYEPRKQIAVIEHETQKMLNGVTTDEELEKLKEKDPKAVKPGISFMPHDLRRTFAKFAEKNASYTELKRLLNHSTEDDVTQGYLIISVDDLRAPMQQITNAIKIASVIQTAKIIPMQSRKKAA
jgi:integrase